MSLYELERDGNAQELIRLLRESDDERVKTRAAELLGNFEDHDDRRDVVNALVNAAQSDSDAITGAAIDSLDELGDDAITQLIGSMAGVDLEDDAADWVKAKAYMQVLDADVPELRMAAANGLGNLDQADAVPKLAERFEDADPRVRARAARSAGQTATRGQRRRWSPSVGPKSWRQARGGGCAGEYREPTGASGAVAAVRGRRRASPAHRRRGVRELRQRPAGRLSHRSPLGRLRRRPPDGRLLAHRTSIDRPTDQSHENGHRRRELSTTDDRSVVVPLVDIVEESTRPPSGATPPDARPGHQPRRA